MGHLIIIDAALPVITFESASAISSTSGTHAGMAFGTENPRRHILVALGHSSVAAPTDVTIGGISATLLAAAVSGFQSVRASIYIAAVPTGTSGTVQITAASQGPSAVALYSIVNLRSTTPTATAISPTIGTGIFDLSVAVGSHGLVVAAAFCHSSNGNPAVWTGIATIDANATISGAESHWFSAAHDQVTSAGTASITADPKATANARAACAVSLR